MVRQFEIRERVREIMFVGEEDALDAADVFEALVTFLRIDQSDDVILHIAADRENGRWNVKVYLGR